MDMDTVIEIWPKDSEDNQYCAIVMEWHEETKDWVNSGIVVREDTPEEAFAMAKTGAIEHGLWV